MLHACSASEFAVRWEGRWRRNEGECRWLDAFEQLPLYCDFEPGGYKINDDESYRPDLLLHPIDVWVEQKTFTPTVKEQRMCRRFAVADQHTVLLVRGLPTLHPAIWVYRADGLGLGPASLRDFEPKGRGLILDYEGALIAVPMDGGLPRRCRGPSEAPSARIIAAVEHALSLPLMPKDRVARLDADRWVEEVFRLIDGGLDAA